MIHSEATTLTTEVKIQGDVVAKEEVFTIMMPKRMLRPLEKILPKTSSSVMNKKLQEVEVESKNAVEVTDKGKEMIEITIKKITTRMP